MNLNTQEETTWWKGIQGFLLRKITVSLPMATQISSLLKGAYKTIVYIRTVIYNAETVSNLTNSYLYIIHVQCKDRRLLSLL